MDRKNVLLMVETSLYFGREVLRGIAQYLVSLRHWSVSLDLRELMAPPPTWLKDWQGDGIITRSASPEVVRLIQRLGIPAVDLTDIHGDQGLPNIWNNHESIGGMAAAHLLERGFRNFAFCGFGNHLWSRRRRDGFLAAIPQPTSCAVFESDWLGMNALPWDEQQKRLCIWLKKLKSPVGVFAANDLRGQNVLDACRRMDLAVPEEVAVIGVDNDEILCDLCDPPLSSVVLNPRRIGFEAAQMLDQLMTGQTPPLHQVVVEPVGVVTRHSTDVLAIDNADVSAAVRFIREHACRGITVPDLLRHLQVSRSVLERLFRKYLRRSPQQEIRLAQLKRVKELLAETELPLTEIASLTGFRHSEYLSVVFKRDEGKTPGEYRRNIQPRVPAATAEG
ncbi:MAG: DNA-binding transcriptional regulator [Pirellulales bacterium]|nr:DNA-binding transcriptional regulator [Pirellulales bacterium]